MYKLIVQGTDIPTQELKTLAKLSGASAIEAIELPGLAHQAFKLPDANPQHREAVQAHVEGRAMDVSYMPASATLADIGLVVMDMDSTLITIECIDEIADMLGIKEQVGAITEQSMRGEIDFSQSLAARVALLAGLEASALQRVYDERLKLTPGALLMLKTLHGLGIKSLLISGGFTFFTERLKSRLDLSETVANMLEISDDKLTGRITGPLIDAAAKAEHLIRLRTELGLRPDQVIALGDGANDLQMLAAAGYGIAYHAKPVVRAKAAYALSHVGLDGVLALFA